MSSFNMDLKPLPDEPDPNDFFARHNRPGLPKEIAPAMPPPVREDKSHLNNPEVEVDHVDPTPEAPAITAYRAEQMRRFLNELARRKIEALRLYEPLPSQHRFHVSRAQQRLARGSNRAGKTLAAAVEIARAVTCQDPHNKFPKEGGRCFCVGKDGKEVSHVMWRKLSRAEAFKMIRDQDTKAWRAFRPWDPADLTRAGECKWAPPLIPRRFIRSIAWENKKENLPSVVTLHTGWELSFFSSLGKPPTGSDIDLAWFDEEIVDPSWYPELQARLLDRHGRFIWSATPQAGTEVLFNLHERAEIEYSLAEPKVAEFVMTLADNPHLDEQAKKDFAASLSEREAEVRVGGEFAIVSFKVFPEYSRETHTVPWFVIPTGWTRYAIIDPGRQVCAVLFGALPPPDQGDHVYVYDELYLRNCSATVFGTEMKTKCAGQNFHAFVIDHTGARIHDMGGGMTVEQQYSMALKENNVKSLTTGHHFIWGSDDKKAGVEAVRRWLIPAGQKKPRLKILQDKCPNLDWEFRHFRYKRSKDEILDDAEDRGRVHLMACMRYFAMQNPRYVKPPAGKAKGSGALTAFKAKQKRKRERDGGPTLSLGAPPRSLV